VNAAFRHALALRMKRGDRRRQAIDHGFIESAFGCHPVEARIVAEAAHPYCVLDGGAVASNS
jgi:hypothetical protein